MSTAQLGDTLDIHGGARDLIFPHHENEIAQSEAATGHEFVKLWMHTGFLTVNGEKMAKSLGNFITIEDALEKYKYSPQQIRMFFAQTHYRSPIDFSEEAIVAAGNSLSTLHSAIHAAKSYPLPASGNAKLAEAAHDAEKKFVEAMDDDFDAPGAFAALFSLAKKISGACSEGSAGKNDALVAAAHAVQLHQELGLEPPRRLGRAQSLLGRFERAVQFLRRFSGEALQLLFHLHDIFYLRQNHGSMCESLCTSSMDIPFLKP